jgi:hypothetical protein
MCTCTFRNDTYFMCYRKMADVRISFQCCSLGVTFQEEGWDEQMASGRPVIAQR